MLQDFIRLCRGRGCSFCKYISRSACRATPFTAVIHVVTCIVNSGAKPYVMIYSAVLLTFLGDLCRAGEDMASYSQMSTGAVETAEKITWPREDVLHEDDT